LKEANNQILFSQWPYLTAKNGKIKEKKSSEKLSLNHFDFVDIEIKRN